MKNVSCHLPYIRKQENGLVDNSADPNVYRVDDYECFDGVGCKDIDHDKQQCFDCGELGIPINRVLPLLMCRKCDHKFFNDQTLEWEC